MSTRVVTERVFAYLLDNVARPTTAALTAHVTYLRSLDSHGILILGGPFRDRLGSVVCILADTEASADAIARADPLVAFGFTLYQVHELDCVETAALLEA